MKIHELKPGAVVGHASGNAYIVISEATPTRPAVAVRHVEISNPSEWLLIKSHDWKQWDATPFDHDLPAAAIK